MATKKAAAKGAANVAPPPPTVAVQEATKTIQAAVTRALRDRQFQPKLKGPIYVGIWWDPIKKEFVVVNQFQ